MEDITKKHNFIFKKQYGQNFLTDTNLLSAIVQDAGITSKDEVLEIGPGAGALTKELAKKAKKVVAYEIDADLKPILKENLNNFDNVKIEFCDILKVNLNEIKEHFDDEIKVVANLPYYITTPILFYLIESGLNIKSITVMVQKEVADRLVADKNSKNYGRLTVNANAISDVTIKRIVNRKLFYPVPNVDSAIVHFEINKNKYQIDNLKLFKRLVKASFAYRRKTLSNNLKKGFSLNSDSIEALFKSVNINKNARAEDLSVLDFVLLANQINKNI